MSVFQDVTNKNTSFHEQFNLNVVEKKSNNNNSRINGSHHNHSTATTTIASSNPSTTRKRTQTWIEGIAILNQRNKIVNQDVEEAWTNLLRSLPNNNNNNNSIGGQPQQQEQRLYCASLNNNQNNYHTQNFLQEFGFSSSSSNNNEEPGLTIFSQQQQQSSSFLDFETQQLLTTHRNLRQSQDRRKKDELGLANLVSNATEQLDLGEGLYGTSVARVRSATQTIECALTNLREEERALGDVVGEAEKVAANITKRIMMTSGSTATTTGKKTYYHQNNNNDETDQHHHFDPMSSSNNQSNNNNNNNHQFSADQKLKNFLDRVDGRTFGWPKQEHECFMHILFSGGFEDPAVTNATPNLGLRDLYHHQKNSSNNLADDEQWVAARVVEKLSPLLPHRLPDDIRKHLALQRELEFLEGQRRLEIKSWRDQREADATLDLGLAAALAREDAELEQEHRKESEFERRSRQEHLHELVDMWKQKKDEAAATAKAAMAVTQRAMEDAKISRRVAIQAATKERTQQLLERRQMMKNAALWSNAAKMLGCNNDNNNNSSSSPSSSAINHANRQHHIPISCSSNMDRAALNYALQERREQALNKARERRDAVEMKERQKTEREDKMKLRAELVRTATVSGKSSSNNRTSSLLDNNQQQQSSTTSRLMQPTKSMTARKQATIEQETAAYLNAKALCRQTPYFTPRTMSSHKRGAPFM